MIKISVVIPTFNEENNIGFLIKNLLSQSYPANEILICDGGSNDKTIEIVKNYAEKYKIIKIIPRKGKCRGSGRNSGIYASKNKYVALIDAGTYPDKYWLQKLINPITKNKKIMIVYGAAKPKTSTITEKGLGAIIISKKNKLGLLYPTVSSILFDKFVWQSVGKFPESNNGEYIVEDLIFLEKLKKFKSHSILEVKSIVTWNIPSNFLEIFKRFKNFSRGGIKAGYAKTWHYGTLRNFFIFFIILVFLIISKNHYLLIILITLILVRSYLYLKHLSKIYNQSLVKFIYQLFVTSFIFIIIDFSTIFGLIDWIILDKLKINKKW